MRILIAEDDFISRKFMHRFLSKYGDCDVCVDGEEAILAFTSALEEGEGFDLFCLVILMPYLVGYQVLKMIRDVEIERGITKAKTAKVIMTTALSEGRNVTKAFDLDCTAYAGKPIDPDKFEQELMKLGLLRTGQLTK